MGNGGSIIGGVGGTTTKSTTTTSASRTPTTTPRTTTSSIKTTTTLLLSSTSSLVSQSVKPSSTSGLASESLANPTTVATTVSSIPGTAAGSAIASSVPTGTVGGSPVTGASVDSTILVFARNADDAYIATSGLNGYGIPFQTVIVPISGVASLPTLNSSTTSGNYGGIIIHAELSYDMGGGNFSSALTTAQWNQIYAYQVAFNVRLARLDSYPGINSDTTVVGGCCNTGVEQLLSFTDVSDFPTAGLKTNAGVTSQGLYHYPATITNTTRTKQIAAFGPASDGSITSINSAAVINNFDGRQQMVWFTSMATVWSLQTNWIQHSWINWLTRGTFAGRRRLQFNTQIDDVHLPTDIYYPAGNLYRTVPADFQAHAQWLKDINSRMPTGSKYVMELGHNGNGDIDNATSAVGGNTICNPNTPVYTDDQGDYPYEVAKPLGTGKNLWPLTPTTYGWSLACAKLDILANWFTTPANRDAFYHISHTFTHLELNNATAQDAAKEIQFNQAWLKQVGISAGTFSSSGIIPPAITGLNNGDVIRAWAQNGIVHVVGDNTRPILMNRTNDFWPVTSTVAKNGYAGLTIMGRWATTIYYNCDTLDCTHQEWITTSTNTGTINDLLIDAKVTNVRNLLTLRQDPFMFHQANLRTVGMPSVTVGPVTGTLSIMQHWVEIVTQELSRITSWPYITYKQDDLAQQFKDRVTRDNCNYKLKYQYSNDGKTLTSVTVTANGNTCGAAIPVTVPADATVSGSGSVTKDKLGNDPTINWVTLSGSPVTLTLSSPVKL